MAARPGRPVGGRAVAAVVVALAVAAVGRSAARKSAGGPNCPGAFSVALLGPLAGSWLALGIVDSIAGALGGLVSKPVDWARSMIQGVVSWITDWVSHVVDWAGHAFDAIDGVLRRLWDFGDSIVTWARSMVTTAFDHLTTWVGRLVTDARNLAVGLVDQLGRWAEGAIGDLWSFGHGIVDWVDRNIWQPLVDRIEGAISWVQTSVIPWAARIVDDLRSWAGSAFDHVWGWLAATVQPFIGWATTLLQAVDKAFGWIVWIGTRPLSWVRDALSNWMGWDSRNATASLVDAITRESDMVADHLVRWLG